MSKTILITGASKGIGKKIADYLSTKINHQIINISRTKNNNKKIKNGRTTIRYQLFY